VNFVSYAVETKADLQLAWDVYADWTLWQGYSSAFGEIRWISGEPLQKGSRLSIEILHPVHTHVQRVILVCVPAKRVAWIDHALGTTFEEWLYFEPMPSGGTRVHTWAEFTGILSVVAGRPLKRVVQEVIETWLNSYRAECDRQAVNRAEPSR
jgi:hypothetical protein